MAFVPDFSATQSAQDPTSFGLIDNSVLADDPNITNRNINLQLYDGTYMLADGTIGTDTTPIPFPLSDGASITFTDVLPIDYSISATMRWLDAGGIVLYSLTQTFCFRENGEDEDYSLTQSLSGNISLLQDTYYVANRFKLRMFLEAANNAVLTGNDISASQTMLDLATEMALNENKYF